MWTVLNLITETESYLKKKGIPSARLDAEILLAKVLKVERLQLYLQFDRPIQKNELDAYRSLIVRRAQSEPIAYLKGEKEFWSRKFLVGPGVLIPRPETELLVEHVIKFFSSFPKKPTSILDMGCGSGILAITLALEFPESTVVAVDISEEALYYARLNAEAHGAGDRIRFIKTDFFHDITVWKQNYDLVVSNPPYIPSNQIQNLMPDVKNFEPVFALDGGEDGLTFYKYFVSILPQITKEHSLVALEVDGGIGEKVCEMFYSQWKVELVKDYGGQKRVVLAKGKNG